MGSLIRWDSPALHDAYVGVPLAIVGTGPSHDLLEPDALQGFHVFALNAAITEYWDHPDGVTWCCHDFHKIFRHGLRDKIKGWKHWRLVTRRVNIPGQFGEIAYRAVDGGQVKRRFQHPMTMQDLRRADIFWYSELQDQEGFLLAQQTVVEVALECATFWGFSPIVIAGIDLERTRKNVAYGSPWNWKPCKIRPHKFEKMRKMFLESRNRWPERVYSVSPFWKQCPFARLEKPRDAFGIESEVAETG